MTTILSPEDWQAIGATLKLSLVTTFFLLLIGIALAWWLSQTRSRLKIFVEAFVALPLILPPTVLGFYLLLAMGPQGPIGKITNALGFSSLAFTFEGLVLASMCYSLPFVVRPLQNAFESIGIRPLEVAATLGAGPWDRFFSLILPMIKQGILTASILGFAHTIGEFGVVLMVGGNIPGVTRVLSIHLYDQVEALEYSKAHWLAGIMIIFSFLILLLLHMINNSHSKNSKKIPSKPYGL